ncbi:phosphopyruvate hydratase, partial [bacterium]|nr:phosphopyruvate hydratase [bacterium]
DQRGIDLVMLELDGTENLSKLGANAVLGVSMAVARASAMELGIPLWQYLGGVGAKTLPVPMMNVINGGVHADNNLDIQEFMIVPAGFESFSDALRAGSEIYHHLKKVLESKGLSTGVGDEGGFAPDLENNFQALEIIAEAVKAAGYALGKQVFLAIDAAASSFFSDGKYMFEGKELTAEEMIDYYRHLLGHFPLVSIEDGLAENDWSGWEKLRTELGDSVQLVGDDIFVTNPTIIARGIKEKIANAALIKLNQIGTVTKTLDAVELAHRAGWNTVISHRSGETCDDFIADLAVAVNSGQIKAGAPCRAERVAKYNRLLVIEEELGETAHFPSISELYPWLG